MIEVYKNKSACSGCTACKNICPKGAINMQEDEKKFLYPVINADLCIDCGKCAKVCMTHFEQPSFKDNEQRIYALQHTDKSVVKNSSSGGAFTLVSDVVLQQGGVIFGCVIDENMNVVHTMAANAEERDRMRGSKYVMSDMQDVYKQVKEQCQIGKPVLFVGTPCQVEGLNLFLAKIPDNLITVDFICHGAPSVNFFADHIRFLEKKYGKKIIDYKFRDKKYGWRYIETAVFEDKTKKTNYWTFRFKRFFVLNVNSRSSCYECKFASIKRVSDITIGDFWGAEKVLNNYDNIGISVFIVNSPKGAEILERIPSDCVLKQVTQKDIITQRALKEPAQDTEKFKKDEFWDTYLKYGYEKTVIKYSEPKWKHHIRYVPVSIIVALGLDKYFNKLKVWIRKRLHNGK